MNTSTKKRVKVFNLSTGEFVGNYDADTDPRYALLDTYYRLYGTCDRYRTFLSDTEFFINNSAIDAGKHSYSFEDLAVLKIAR